MTCYIVFLNILFYCVSYTDSYESLLSKLRRHGLCEPKAVSRYVDADGYQDLAKEFQKYEPINRQESWMSTIFGSLFLNLLWSLMSRPEGVELIQLQYITWRGDCLFINENGKYFDLESI